MALHIEMSQSWNSLENRELISIFDQQRLIHASRGNCQSGEVVIIACLLKSFGEYGVEQLEDLSVLRDLENLLKANVKILHEQSVGLVDKKQKILKQREMPGLGSLCEWPFQSQCLMTTTHSMGRVAWWAAPWPARSPVRRKRDLGCMRRC